MVIQGLVCNINSVADNGEAQNAGFALTLDNVLRYPHLNRATIPDQEHAIFQEDKTIR